MGIEPTAIMSYEKYVQAHIRLPIHGRRQIKGKFKEKGNNKVISGDNFSCIVFGRGSAFECYKAAVAYFNYTRSENEKEREAVSAKWDNISIPSSAEVEEYP